jgi:hypothetical protein
LGRGNQSFVGIIEPRGKRRKLFIKEFNLKGGG